MPTKLIYGTTGPDHITLLDGHDPSLTYDVIAQGYGGDGQPIANSLGDYLLGDNQDANAPGSGSFAATDAPPPSSNIIYGTTGADSITVPDGHNPALTYDNIVYGLGGDDGITGGTGNDWIWGSTTDGPSVTDNFHGGAGDDVLISYANANLYGGAGNDVLIDSKQGALGDLEGGDGNDSLWALGGITVGRGTQAVSMQLFGGNGDDLLVGGTDLEGGDGNDLLIATVPGTQANGGNGNDTLYAASGASGVNLNGDYYYGNLGISGADTLVGNGLHDGLAGGVADGRADVLIGASGQDVFVADGTPGVAVADLAWNFELGTDLIHSDVDTLNLSNGIAAYMSDYAFTEPDGTVSHLSGTLLSAADSSPLLFIAGENLTMAQLIAAGTFAPVLS